MARNTKWMMGPWPKSNLSLEQYLIGLTLILKNIKAESAGSRAKNTYIAKTLVIGIVGLKHKIELEPALRVVLDTILEESNVADNVIFRNIYAQKTQIEKWTMQSENERAADLVASRNNNAMRVA